MPCFVHFSVFFVSLCFSSLYSSSRLFLHFSTFFPFLYVFATVTSLSLLFPLLLQSAFFDFSVARKFQFNFFRATNARHIDLQYPCPILPKIFPWFSAGLPACPMIFARFQDGKTGKTPALDHNDYNSHLRELEQEPEIHLQDLRERSWDSVLSKDCSHGPSWTPRVGRCPEKDQGKQGKPKKQEDLGDFGAVFVRPDK